MAAYKTIKYEPVSFSDQEMVERSADFYHFMNLRRTVREFSNKPIPESVLQNILLTANTAPSGANKQPWIFCVVTNPETKQKIRQAAEQEEFENYHNRMSEEWLEDLAPLGTDWHKEFLEMAPCLIVVFKKSYDLVGSKKKKNYYVQESVGLACGFLLAAIHHAGLVSLTHTPSPMNFLQQILNRPENEKPFLLIPIGYPAIEIQVPDISRKKPEEFLICYK